jgi:hypothetical protein
MSRPCSIPYDNFVDETKYLVDNCYPSKKTTLISATTLLYELTENKDKYPLYSSLSSDRHRKIVITHNCVDAFKWELWGKNRGQYRNGATYRREVS